MSSNIFKKSVVTLAILASTALPLSQAWADGMGPVMPVPTPNDDSSSTSKDSLVPLTPGQYPEMEVNLLQGVQETDEADLQKAALAQAESLKLLPGDLRAQGIEVSADQELKINQFSETLTADANKPGLKDRMTAALKKTGKGGKKAGIVVLKSVGWAGEASLGLVLAPMTFGTDLVASTITGKGVFSSGQNGLPALVGEVGGIASLYYSIVAINAIGIAFEGPLLGAGIGIVVVNQFVCAGASNSKNLELKNYCDVNTKIMKTLWSGSAKGGEIIGSEIHKGLVGAGHLISKPFRRGKKLPSPAPSSSASPAPEADQK